MRCDCCDRILSDKEATSKFVDGRYTNMCTACQDYLPPEIKIVNRKDLDEPVFDNKEIDYDDFWGTDE